MRERPHRNHVNAATGVRFQIRFRDPSARFDKRVIPEAFSPEHFDNGRGVIGRHVIEHQQTRILFGAFLLKATKRSCCRTRCVLAAHFDFDECGFLPKSPSLLNGERRRVRFTHSQERQMIILDNNRIAEAEAMGAAIAEMQRTLIQQAPRSLSRADDSHRGSVLSGTFLQATDRGGDPAHPLNKIQGDSFEGKELRFGARCAHQYITMLHDITIVLLDHNIDTMSPEHVGQLGQTCYHTTTTRPDASCRTPVLDSKRLNRQVVGCKISPQEGLRDRANCVAIDRILDRESPAMEKRLLDSLLACRVQMKCRHLLLQKESTRPETCFGPRNHFRSRRLYGV
jgi:hypothetical protein